MNRPAQYHISDPVLPWVYSATEADAYFDHIEAELSACKERVRELTRKLKELAGDGEAEWWAQKIWEILEAQEQREEVGE